MLTFDSTFLKILGNRSAIVQAPMAGVSTPALAAARVETPVRSDRSASARPMHLERGDGIADFRAQVVALAFTRRLLPSPGARRRPFARRVGWNRLRPEFARFDAEPPRALRRDLPELRGGRRDARPRSSPSDRRS